MTTCGIVLLIGTIGILLGLLESVRECKDFVVTHYHIDIARSSKVTSKVILISDLHNKEYGENNCRLLDAIRNEKPDVIVVAGDILVGKANVSTEIASRFNKELAKIAPVYYGNGNHEQRMRDFPEVYGLVYEEYKSEVLDAGITLLENESVELQLGNQKVAITGLEIPHKFFEKCSMHDFQVSEVEEQVGKASERYQILIAHSPMYSEAYVNWGADLVLSGHYHGGVVRVPYLGAVITPQFKLFPKYSGGHHHYKESDIVVSRGLGEHTIKLRFLNKPELVVLHLDT